jgi:uncharacterized protein (TIGR03435 family)
MKRFKNHSVYFTNMRLVPFSVGLAILVCALAFGQPTRALTFEVASVKPSPPPREGVYFGPARGGPGSSDPGQIKWEYARLIDMLMTAYDVKSYQVRGPVWMSTERYHVIAKVPEGATKDQVIVMWQSLLAERFGVVLHHESKEFQVEELVVAKGGSKLKDTAVDDPNAEGPPKLDKNMALNGPGFVTTITMGSNRPTAHTVAKAQPLSKLTVLLGSQLDRPVLDKTGLTGKYDFSIEFAPNLPPGQLPPPTDNASEPSPTLVDALERQLGLRLVANKAKLDLLVIDKAEKTPTAN